MTLISRRTALVFAATFALMSPLAIANAADTLPDTRFVGYAQALNDFEISSARLALAKSSNENVRGFAAAALAHHTDAAERLSRSRSEAGVIYAPDPARLDNNIPVLQRLGTLEGPEFDTAYANAQLAVLTDAKAQYGANSQSGGLKMYAQAELPKLEARVVIAQRLAGGL